jgi:putative pyruvate formate lyase activating enzyme
VAKSFLIEGFEPSYLRLQAEGLLAPRAEAALVGLESCHVCPRCCGDNRLEGETGTCQTGRHALVSSAFPHLGEEDCLRGSRGSGTIFFGLCNLGCDFCQNWDISHQPSGRECDAGEIASLMLDLQARGCHNINFVTPGHLAPQVVEAVAAAVPSGLRLPIVYNTSAYDSLSSLELLDGIVDIYMPDFKFWRPETGQRLARARDYPDRAREAVLEMQRQVGPLRLGPDGVARRGVLVRHLVMPGLGDETAAIFEWLAREVSPDTFVNVMRQYRPAHRVGEPDDRGQRRHPDLDRGPTRKEMDAAYTAARQAGLWRFDDKRRRAIFLQV